MVHKRGVDWAVCQKPSHQGSVLVNEMQGVAWVCQGGCLGVGECGVEVVEVHVAQLTLMVSCFITNGNKTRT